MRRYKFCTCEAFSMMMKLLVLAVATLAVAGSLSEGILHMDDENSCADPLEGVQHTMSLMQVTVGVLKKLRMPAEAADQASAALMFLQGSGATSENNYDMTKLLSRCVAVSVVVFAVAGVLVALGVNVNGNSPEQAARSVYLTVNFVLVMNYTIVILDSYDLCASLGLSQADSGRMVGTYMLGFCFGALGMWWIVDKQHDLWRHSAPRIILLGLSCQLLGALAYCVVAIRATTITQSADFANIPFGVYEAMFGLKAMPGSSALMMGSRFVSGVGSGACQQFYVSATLHLTPIEARAEHTGRWVFSGMLAIGLGPMVAAALQALPDGRGGVAPDFVPVGFAQLTVVLGAVAAVVLYHPDLRDVEDHMISSAPAPSPAGAAESAVARIQLHSRPSPSTSPDSSPSSLAREYAGRRVLICGCLAMGSLRAFGVAAVEVVMASLLEDNYHWDQRSTGLAIGSVFLCCIPLKVIHKTVGDSLSPTQWIRLLSCIAIAGCTLLFHFACDVVRPVLGHTACSTTLVIAGVVLFPTFYLGESLACGIMHQHVLSPGSWFDGNHSQLWYNLAQGMGRFLGPWLARLVVMLSGQDSFALQQLVICVAFLCIFETFVRSFMRKKV